MQIASLHRYPVKGLSPEAVSSFMLRAGEYVPGDRLFAVENGPSGFDPSTPQHQPKIKFLQLMRHERLARLRTRFDDDTSVLTITSDGHDVRADLRQEHGRDLVRTFFAGVMAAELRGVPQVLEAPRGFRFTDSRSGYVSILNLASVGELERLTGRRLNPLRFRANLAVSGLAPFAELDLVGSRLVGPGSAALEVTKRTVRCAAVNVDPETGARDIDLPRFLLHHYGHADCGVYARIVRSGRVSAGDRLDIEQATLPLDGVA